MAQVKIVTFIIISLLLSACGGEDLEYVPGESSYTPPASTGGGEETPPPKEEDPPHQEEEDDCEAAPASIDLRVFNSSCSSNTQLEVTVKEGNQFSSFAGRSFVDNQGRNGLLVYLVDEKTSPDCKEPIDIVAIASNGSIDFQTDKPIHSYLVSEELASILWKRMTGEPPSLDDIMSSKYSHMIHNIVTCLRGEYCPLPSTAGGIPGGTLEYLGLKTDLATSTLFCGKQIVVMTNSRLPI